MAFAPAAPLTPLPAPPAGYLQARGQLQEREALPEDWARRQAPRRAVVEGAPPRAAPRAPARLRARRTLPHGPSPADRARAAPLRAAPAAAPLTRRRRRRPQSLKKKLSKGNNLWLTIIFLILTVMSGVAGFMMQGSRESLFGGGGDADE